MRPTLKLLALATLIIAAFFAGATTAGLRHWFQPVIKVTVANESGQDISGLQLSLETSRQKTITELGPLGAGKTHTIPLLVTGEGSYVIVATLADGRQVSGMTGYVEPGYAVKETVKAATITSEVSLYGI